MKCKECKVDKELASEVGSDEGIQQRFRCPLCGSSETVMKKTEKKAKIKDGDTS